eukprot:scaffold23194_cov30-Tisochrysis_lutea.AAC.1
MIDLGTGNNNKINWAIHDKQEVIDIIETVYRGARKGRGLVVSPKDYSTKRVVPVAVVLKHAWAVVSVRQTPGARLLRDDFLPELEKSQDGRCRP